MAKGPRPTLRLLDRIVLLVAWLVTCGLVYVLGYYVGRGTPGRQATIEERAVRLPVTSAPPAEGQRPKESKEFPTFYQALPAGDRPIDVARGTTVTAPSAGGPTPATTPPRATPTTMVSASRSMVSTTTLGRTAAAPPPTLGRAPASPTTTLVRPFTTPPQTPPATLRAPTARASTGSYTVEASPTRSRSEAEQLLSSLRRRGYEAALVEVERDGDTWYRLRVGRYPTAAQAAEAMRRLRDVEGVTHAFVATE
jgi:septal ring-binding cell division protein DamX